MNNHEEVGPLSEFSPVLLPQILKEVLSNILKELLTFSHALTLLYIACALVEHGAGQRLLRLEFLNKVSECVDDVERICKPPSLLLTIEQRERVSVE